MLQRRVPPKDMHHITRQPLPPPSTIQQLSPRTA